MKKYIILSLLALSLMSFFTLDIGNLPELVKEKLQQYITKDAPEKIYIHTDKPYYSLGEDIWFTGYLVDGVTHTANPKSFVFYVELINEKDSIVAKKRLFTGDVTIPGDFKINQNWNQGTYKIRAYTNYMRNDDPNYFFQKEIAVLSTNDDTTEKSNSNTTTEGDSASFKLIKPDLNFYPEGGDLVENIRSEIGVKVKNELSDDVEINGTINDENNTVVSQFTVSKYGVSKFSFTPQPNKTYSANVQLNGSEYNYPFPKALPNGHALTIINKGSYLLITAKSNTVSGLNQSYLFGHQRGKIVFEKFEATNTNTYSLKLLTNELNDGITHFTLFNADGNPVCERLVFVENPKNETTVDIEKDKDIIGTREQLKVKLNVKNLEGKVLPSHLSMSVRDLNAFPEEIQRGNIKSWLLLNSDLRGEIKNPGNFINEKNINKKRYLLDLLMLTHGWRRFTWKDLINKKEKNNEFPIEKGLFITGKTKELNSPYSIVPAVSRLTFLNNYQQEPNQPSQKGTFSFGPYVFFDTIPVLIESRLTNDFISKDIKNRKLAIVLDRPSKGPLVKGNSEDISDKNKNEAFLKITKYMNQIHSDFKNQRQLLYEVVIKAKRKEEENERQRQIRERADYGDPTHRLDLESGIPVRGVSTAYDLIIRVPGVTNDVKIRGQSPLLIIDNIPVGVDYMQSVPSDDVSFIDVLTGANTSMFINGGGGVIVVYTKHGYTNEKKSKPGRMNFTAEGFYLARKFYAPNHINSIEEQMKADIRTTLHWEPEIKIKEETTSEVSFFTSDSKGEYLIEIEGISKTGIPLYQTSKFTVK